MQYTYMISFLLAVMQLSPFSYWPSSLLSPRFLLAVSVFAVRDQVRTKMERNILADVNILFTFSI